MTSTYRCMQSTDLASGDLVDGDAKREIDYATPMELIEVISGDYATPMELIEVISGCLDAVSDDEMMAEADKEPELVPPGIHKSFPSLLLKFLKDEAEEVRTNSVNLMAVAVHAVFLDNGFVSFDSPWSNAATGSGLQHGWAAAINDNKVEFRYSLSSLLAPTHSLVETVELQFQVSDNFLTVHGFVDGKGTNLMRLSLDASCYGPSIMFLLDHYDGLKGGTPFVAWHEKQVFELEKMIKDKLLLPLHIDICERAGLPAPPNCFTSVPTDMKFLILELLSWRDLAKIASVCREMKILSTDDYLLKQKYREAFGRIEMVDRRDGSWKSSFADSFSTQKKMEADMAMRRKGYDRRGPINGFAPIDILDPYGALGRLNWSRSASLYWPA